MSNIYLGPRVTPIFGHGMPKLAAELSQIGRRVTLRSWNDMRKGYGVTFRWPRSYFLVGCTNPRGERWSTLGRSYVS